MKKDVASGIKRDFWLRIIVCLFVLLVSPWTWRIFSRNIIIGLSLVGFSVVLTLAAGGKLKQLLLLTFFFLVYFQQWQTTEKINLAYLDNDGQRVQQMRLRQYPPLYINFLGKKIWIPLGHWLEGRSESIILRRVKDNFGELMDLNLYFFANHPRERVGIREFEKFYFLFLPFFIWGVVSLVKKWSVFIWVLVVILPIVLTSIVGHRNELGSFSLFPFMVMAIVHGLVDFLKMVNEKRRIN